MQKKIKALLPATEIDMGGIPVKQALPTAQVQQIDPFLLLHHAQFKVNAEQLAKHQGIGPHPHRGFSPVTFVIEGELRHQDSRGNDQIARAGEVQWMHAGAGIVHSERPTQSLVEEARKQEIIQLWINSPASKKMNPPEYHYLPEPEMPVFFSEDGRIENKLVAGKYAGYISKTPTQSPLLIIWGKGVTEGQVNFRIPEGFNSMLYLTKGLASIKGYGRVEAEHLVYFDQEGSMIELEIKEDYSQYLLLCGLPIDEEVNQYGPYVMNSQTEILEAIRDYQMGKMGILIED